MVGWETEGNGHIWKNNIDGPICCLHSTGFQRCFKLDPNGQDD